jgi:hypothetical protein
VQANLPTADLGEVIRIEPKPYLQLVDFVNRRPLRQILPDAPPLAAVGAVLAERASVGVVALAAIVTRAVACPRIEGVACKDCTINRLYYP